MSAAFLLSVGPRSLSPDGTVLLAGGILLLFVGFTSLFICLDMEVRGNQAVAVTLRSGKEVYVGSRFPQRLAGRIEAAMRGASG